MTLPTEYIILAILWFFIILDLVRVTAAFSWRHHYKKKYGAVSSQTHTLIPDESILVAGSSFITERPALGPTVVDELRREGYQITLRVDEPLFVHGLLDLLYAEKQQIGDQRYRFVIIGIGENDIAIKPWSVFSTKLWEQFRKSLKLASELGDTVIFVHGWKLIPGAPAIPWLYRNLVLRPSVLFALFFLRGEREGFPKMKIVEAPKNLEVSSDGTHITAAAHKYLAWVILQVMQESLWNKKKQGGTSAPTPNAS